MTMPAASASTPVPADGTLPVERPLALENPDAATWDLRCDVLVIGFGAAGAAAAIAAREAGTAVLIAERFDGGGATALSGGIVYAGGGTSHQKKAGYEDTVEEMVKYLRQESGDAVSEETLHRFCADSREQLEWLESLGASFDSDDYSQPPPKTSYPKDGVYLYYSGNEGVPSFAAQAKPAPRGHRTRGSGVATGSALFEALKRKVQALEIPVLTRSSVHRLITDAISGAVIGAELRQLAPGSAAEQQHRRLIAKAEKIHPIMPAKADRLRAQALQLELTQGRRQRVRAGRVILSAGGFIFNRDMVSRLAPKYAKAMRLGATGCDGSGIRLGESVGGVAARMERGSAWRFINPPVDWPKGIAVNAQGRRFCNEQVYGARLGVEMCDHNDGRAWLIIDAKLRSSALREAAFGGLWFFQGIPSLVLMLMSPRAKTPEALAAKIGLPAQALRETLDQYNAAIHSGTTDALGKSESMRQALEQGPYYALDISADSKLFPCPAITLGGLRVDESSGAVLDAAGKPISGLYAAGRSAVGVASNRYVSGLSIADCLWSGRRAGRHAAQK